jgi:hypothetical protein
VQEVKDNVYIKKKRNTSRSVEATDSEDGNGEQGPPLRPKKTTKKK